MSVLLKPYLTADIDSETYALRDGAIRLDAGAVPYASADIVLPLLEESPLDYLNPTTGDIRVPIAGGDALTGESRTFDLGLRDRVVDHVAKTVRLTLAGDEALLMDYATLTDDTTPRTHQASLRAICDYVLGKIGAALEATPSTDADVTAYWELTNLIPNPNFVANITGYVTGGGCTIAWNSTAGAVSGNGFLRATMTAASGAVTLAPSGTSGYSVTPGKPYTLSLYQRTSTAAVTALSLRWYNSDNVLIRTDLSPQSALPTVFTRFSWIATAPAGASKVIPFVHIASSASTRTWDIDRINLVQDDEMSDYFDGATAPAGYTTSWDDVANASQSTRVPITDRPRSSLTWEAGQPAWDFLMNLAASVGLVLWCDELRVWRLQTPESRALPALLSVSSGNTREGTDTLSRDDPLTFITGVVVRYIWTDTDGILRTDVDSAGTPEKPLVVELRQAYPGPGAAAAILFRRAGSGRAQGVATITQWTASPGMTASITLPAAPETYGRVAAVEFRSDGFMTLEMAGLIDIIPGSVDALGGTIDALAGTIDAL